MSRGNVGLIRGVRFFLNLSLLLGSLATLGFFVWMLVSAATGAPESGFDIAMPVAVGEGTWKPVLTLSPSSGTEPTVTRMRLVDGLAELRFVTSDIRTHLVWNGLLFLGTVIALWEIYLLQGILKRTAEGAPFHARNARDLTLMAWIALLAGLGGPLAEHLLGSWIVPRVQPAEMILSPRGAVDPEGIVLGFLLLILASVWRQAVVIAEDQSLTV